MVLGGYLIYIYGQSSGAWLALHGGAWVVMLGCLLAVCREMLRQFLPAVGALAFLLLAPLLLHDGFASPAQYAVTELTWTVCHIFGVADSGAATLTVHHLAQAVSEAASGPQLLLGLCVVAYAFAFARPMRPGVQVLILALAPLVAMMCSIVAVVVMVWLLGQVSPAADSLVMISRWGILAVALAVLGGLLRIVAWATVPLRMYPLASVDT